MLFELSRSRIAAGALRHRLDPARASKRALGRKLRTGRIGTALEIDAQHVVIPSDDITI
jgi:hypothetical protein